MWRSLRHLLAVCLALVAGAASAALPACSGRGPYSWDGDTTYTAKSPTELCGWWMLEYQKWRKNFSILTVKDNACILYSEANSTFPDPASDVITITKDCEPEAPGFWEAADLTLTSEKVADYLELFGLFLAAAVTVLAARSVYNRFRIDHDHA